MSEQRNTLFNLLRKLDNSNSIIGGKVNKKEYLNELSLSKLSISPFGFGEICYRDFESILNKCLLLKPNMSHLETYPDFFKERITYIPLNWDLEDTILTIEKCLQDFDSYHSVIENAFNLLQAYHNDESLFIDHLKKLVANL